jgi:hypothetical protein
MEHEWQTSTDLEAMLEQVREASPRKLRLFAVACCRKIQPPVRLINLGDILRAVERCAEEDAKAAELSRIRHSVHLDTFDEAITAVINATSASAWGAANATAYSAACATAWAKTDTNVDAAIREETAAQSELLREIFGNPYRPMPARPEAIIPLAEAIYCGQWELMPLLGEWLQEHGFWEIGEHCLDPSMAHFKGCWVVDWVLGKE